MTNIYSEDEVLARFDPYVILDRAGGSGVEPRIRQACGHGKIFAAKKIVKWKLTPIGWDNMKKSIDIHNFLCSFNYSGIVTLYDVLEDEECNYVIMEEMDGDLLTLLEKRKRIPEDEAKIIFRQIVEIIEFIHDKGICHQDLKPDNILFSWDREKPDTVGRIKLTDFDFASHFDVKPYCTIPCGSPSYAAPEICVDSPKFKGNLSDIWSLGVTLFVLLCGEFPWRGSDTYELWWRIRMDPVPLPFYLSSQCKDLLVKILSKQPEERLTLAQIKEHPWLQNTNKLNIERTPNTKLTNFVYNEKSVELLSPN